MRTKSMGFRSALGLTVMCLGFGTFTTFGHRGPKDTDREAIRSLLTAQTAAWNRGDVKQFMQGYWNSPELTFGGSTGFVRGWEPVTARYLKSYPDQTAMGKLDFSELEIRMLGPEAALVLGKWHLARTGGDLGGIFSLVFQKFPDGWKIVHDHTSATTPAQPEKPRANP